MTTTHMALLVNVLADLYPSIAASHMIMAEVGVRTTKVLVEQAPLSRWLAIVKECESVNSISALLGVAMIDYPDNINLRNLYSILINNKSRL